MGKIRNPKILTVVRICDSLKIFFADTLFDDLDIELSKKQQYICCYKFLILFFVKGLISDFNNKSRFSFSNLIISDADIFLSMLNN